MAECTSECEFDDAVVQRFDACVFISSARFLIPDALRPATCDPLLPATTTTTTTKSRGRWLHVLGLGMLHLEKIRNGYMWHSPRQKHKIRNIKELGTIAFCVNADYVAFSSLKIKYKNI
jgi:hypothetical protein